MSTNTDQYNYTTLRVYLYYRLIVASVLYMMFEAGISSSAFGLTEPTLFRYGGLAYLLVTLASLTLLFDRYSYRSTLKIAAILLSDLGALLVLIHASGGLAGGLGYLLVITAAAASMFLSGRLSLAYASLVSILIIIQTLFITPYRDVIKALFSAGSLGFLLFITAISFRYLTLKIQVSTQEAEEKGAYAQQLVKLAQLIVTRMQTGITVLTETNEIALINESALQHLDLVKQQNYLGEDITDITDLGSVISTWRKQPVSGLALVHKLKGKKELRINFALVETETTPLTILYIEDYRTLMQQAQQLKLASLGRLTASIAHEIRNPLGAISHAAQLLGESEKLADDDSRFLEIILQHCQRVNEIIENTMSLSKRKEPKAVAIDLKTWIPQFIDEYSSAKKCTIDYQWNDEQENIKMDPTHLRQILTNLFDNGLRYSMESIDQAEIHIRSGVSKYDDTTFIDVIDFGPGVPADKISEIFEPFFTTGSQGTGLGLYISRELCEINQARLDYVKTHDGKSRFRIHFPHHQRII